MTFLPRHRSHDYPWLMAQWRRVAKAARMEMSELACVGDQPVHQVISRAARCGEPVVYVSAGVHGDEPAAVCGLLAWAMENTVLLRDGGFVILPCLNPHGLMLNTRVDHRGRDLNRRFQLKRDPLIGAWHRLVGPYRMSVALCLHEDYDAEGFYLYEVDRRRQSVGQKILDACEGGVIARDTRSMIDGMRANRAVIRKKKVPEDLPGLPEAIVLHQFGCPLTLTFETPSEFGLNDRAEAHARFIQAALDATGIPS